MQDTDQYTDEELAAIALADGVDPWAGQACSPVPTPQLTDLFLPQTAPEDVGIDPTLTAGQREVVEALTGPLIVVAGPGAGKTKTLVERVVNANRTGTAPHRILVVSFTRKAAAEVRDRLEICLGEERASAVHVTTFHGLAGRILRAEGHRIGLRATYDIMSSTEQRTLIRALVRQHLLSSDPDYVRDLSRAKRNPELSSTAERATYLYREAGPDQAELLRAYEAEKRRLNRLDYDDLIVIAHHLLSIPEVQETWCGMFDHIMVDEYQDTDPMQHEIIQRLSRAATSVMAVGDLDQSIYAFRGADPRIFADFPTDFPGAQVLYLNENFRSTPQVLRAARAIIDTVEVPYRTELTAVNNSGPVPELLQARDQVDEAAQVTKWVQGLLARGTPAAEIGVLYRGRRQGLQLQSALTRARVPFTLSGSVGFYESKQVKNVLAWLRLAATPDELAFQRVVEQIPGLGEKFQKDTWASALDQRGGDVVEYLRAQVAAADAAGKASQKRVTAQRSIVELVDQLRQSLDTGGLEAAVDVATRAAVPSDAVVIEGDPAVQDWMDVAEILRQDAISWQPSNPLPLEDGNLVYHYLHGSGVMTNPSDSTVHVQYFNLPDSHEGFTYEALPPADDLDRAPVAAQVLTVDGENPLPPILEFLQELSVDNQPLADDSRNAVTLSTIHAAKGREWDHVAVIGLVDGLFPLGFPDRGQMLPASDEDRRVMFVALSRARKSLLLSTYRTQRLRDGGSMYRRPSILLYDLAEAAAIATERPLPRKPRPEQPQRRRPGFGTW